MNPEDGSEAGSVAEALPQEAITMLLNVQDFHDKVSQDPANLCCIIVTSTLCCHCGIRRIPYPKPAHLGNSTTGGNEDEDDDDAADGGGDDGDGEEDGSQGSGSGAAHGAGTGHFYRDVETRIVQKRDTAKQRRHVRFFHVCACMEEETCVDFLIAADPAYSVLHREPTAQEVALLHKKAHQQLKELLQLLGVCSTPAMFFYLAGQPLRYTAMASSGSATAVPKGVTQESDVLQVTGANWMKWSQVLQNAVVVRNEVMRTYDMEEREKARAARAEARRQARLQRKKDAVEDEDEEEEDEGDEEA
ncbi:hypothetical protein NESM_000621700 [Novymonas esmeraldas]|uniref:Uncharacterized protein n=1 Tax=Novymonas esmeraldas TaxID=1808958 RepID=A0AAW0EUN1_9TRYP